MNKSAFHSVNNLLLSLHNLKFSKFIKRTIKFFFPSIYVYILARSLNSELQNKGMSAHLRISSSRGRLLIENSALSTMRQILVSYRHLPYINDISNSFDYYFEAVKPRLLNSVMQVDYSKPSSHEVAGFDLFPIHLPSFAEPISTNRQYIEFGMLKEGDVVIDLGAYSGLSSIMFKQSVGMLGTVVAVEADTTNLESLRLNICNFFERTNLRIEVLEAAVWSHSGEIVFSSDGNMGSSASNFLAKERGSESVVRSMTLSEIASVFSLNKVSLIKCDIEGAETEIFDDFEFFAKYSPKIIVEPHFVDGELSTGRVRNVLSKFGYAVVEVNQFGVEYPLLEFTRTSY